MRIAFMAEVLLVSVSLSPFTLVAAENRGSVFANTSQVRQSEKQQESAAVQRINAIQQTLDRHLRVLQQRIAEAEKVRQNALQKNDPQMLKRAEQLERQAISQYERQVQQASDPKRSAPHPNAIRPIPQRSVGAPGSQPPSKRKEAHEKKRSRWLPFRLWGK